MINALAKELENKCLQEENTILKVILKEYVKKTEECKELLQESLELLDKYQEEVENLKIRTDLWVDEVVKQYFTTGDLDEALKLTGREIMLYELNKNKEES